ncbi:PadR family transcriptional regulator [Halomicroarcula sp. F27]|uniref:PadR family transcriptional regulator n=1 Tax=Haloarcula nitratireducens TaxID=2487749 RepID=A0AAW4PJH7_9EURY|nr:PadR family transcriptional regulator [Halomicroarcula nitratireducens]
MTAQTPPHDETHRSPTHYALTGFQRDVCQAIAAVDDEPYGLALKEYLDERYSEPINHSRLYQNLDTLADKGLVSCDPIDDRTNAYTLTDAGHELLTYQAETLASLTNHSRPVTDGGPRTHKRGAERTTPQPQRTVGRLGDHEPAMTLAVAQRPRGRWLVWSRPSVASNVRVQDEIDGKTRQATPDAAWLRLPVDRDVWPCSETVPQYRPLGRLAPIESVWAAVVQRPPETDTAAPLAGGRSLTPTIQRPGSDHSRSVERGPNQ